MAISYDNTNYDLQDQIDILNAHAITNKGSSSNLGLYKMATNGEGHVTQAVAVTKSDITSLGIPAQDTVYTLPAASSNELGGIKTGYSSAGRYYAVQTDENNNGYVNVPWTDTNTEYNDATQSNHGLMSTADKIKLDGILGLVYPVGAIYMSVVNTSPATLFGGTWEAIGGKFLIGADATYAANSTGGSATQTLVTDNLPSHSHSIGTHSHTISTHGHTIATHSHSIGTHSHTIATHNHSVPNHTHGISTHAHTLGDHSHSIGTHSHTIATHSHTVATHSHTVATHAHGLNGHTHTYDKSATSTGGNNGNTGSTTIDFSNGYACMAFNGYATMFYASKTTPQWGSTHFWTVNSWSGQIGDKWGSGMALGGSQAHTHTLNNHTHSITLTSTNSGGNSGNTANGGPSSTGNGGPSSTGNGGPTATGNGGPTATGKNNGNTGNGGPTATTSSGSCTSGGGGPTATGNGGPTSTGNGGPTATSNGGPTSTGDGGPTATGNTGSATAFSIMPPYLSVYIWKRTA